MTNPSDVHSVCSVAVIDSMPEGSGDVKSNDQDRNWWKTWLDYCWEHYHVPFMEWVKKKIFKTDGQNPKNNYEFMAQKEQVHLKKPG